MSRLVDWAAPVVAFVLYTNAAVVGVRYHGVPFVVGASYLLLLVFPIVRDVVFLRRAPVVTPALLCIIGYFCVALVGALLAMLPEKSMGEFQEMSLEGALLYLLFVGAIRTPKVLQRVVWALLAAGVFMGAVVCTQQLLGAYDDDFMGFGQLEQASKGFLVTDIDVTGAPRQQRLTGSLGEPNRFAQVMAVLAPLALLQIYVSRRLAHRMLAVVALGVILVGGSLAFSRGAAIGLGLMVLVMVAMGYAKPRHLLAMGVVLALVAIAVPQYARRLASITEVTSLALEGGSEGLEDADGATRGRLTEMIAAVFIFADHPLVGAGPGMYPEHYLEYSRLAGGKVRAERRQPHSMPLHLASENGMLGLATFGLAVFFTFRDLARARRRWQRSRPDLAHLAAGVTLALVVYLTTGLFLHISYARYFWFTFALAGATAHLVTQEETSPLARLVRVAGPNRSLGVEL